MSYTDGWIVFDSDLNKILAALKGNGVIREWVVEQQDTPTMGVKVAVGHGIVNGTLVRTTSSTNVSIAAADATYPRKDIVCVKSDGTIVSSGVDAACKGTAETASPSGATGPKTSKPKPPDIPSGYLLIAEVWVAAGVSAIYDADITDRRALITPFREIFSLSAPKAFTRRGFYQNSLTQRRAVYKNGKTYVCFQEGGGSLDPYVNAFDHTEKQWIGEIKVGTNPLTDDHHGSPSMILDALNRIHVFFGAHGSNPGYLSHVRSTNPEDISSWTTMPNLTGAHTYPICILTTTGDIYIFTRPWITDRYYEAYIRSTDNGDTFGSITQIIDPGSGGWVYHGNIVYDSINQRIHIVWVLRYTADEYQRVYHAYLNLSDGNMYSMDGTNLGTMIDKTEMDTYCVVFDGGASNTAEGGDVKLDSNGYPMITFTNPRTPSTSVRPKFTKWTGSAWSTPVTIVNDYPSPGALMDCLKVISDTNLEAFFPIMLSDRETFCEDYLKFASTDGGATWQIKRVILVGKSLHYRFVNSFMVFDGAMNYGVDDFEIVIVPYFVYLGDHAWDCHLPMFAWGENGFV